MTETNKVKSVAIEVPTAPTCPMTSLAVVVLEGTMISQPGSILAFLAFDTVPF